MTRQFTPWIVLGHRDEYPDVQEVVLGIKEREEIERRNLELDKARHAEYLAQHTFVCCKCGEHYSTDGGHPRFTVEGAPLCKFCYREATR